MARSARKTDAIFVPFDQIGYEKQRLAAFMKAADAFDRTHNASPESALKQLQKEGILTKSGRLAKRYGG